MKHPSLRSILLASVVSLANLVACSSSYEGNLNQTVVSPSLASVRSIFVAPLVCKSATCPSDLSAYQKGVERGIKQKSDFSLANSSASGDASLYITLRDVRERSGSSWGSDKGAAVSYDAVLKKDGREIWRDVTAVNDEALSDNLLNIKDAKFSWVTAPELFSKQVGITIKKLSRDRQGLFVR